MTDQPLTDQDRADQLRRLEVDIESARQALNAARRYFDRLCDEYRDLKSGGEGARR